MSRPELPRSFLERGEDEFLSKAKLALGIAAAWEVGYFALLLSGNGPQGQIWSVLGRLMAIPGELLAQHSIPGGAMGVLWGIAHPVQWVAVILVVMGMMLVVAVAVHLMDHGLPSIGGRKPPKGPRGGGGGRKPRQEPSNELDTSLEEWLVRQQTGGEEE